MNTLDTIRTQLTRRAFLSRSTTGLGCMAAGSLLHGEETSGSAGEGLAELPHFPARAKRVIYLFQSGGPSQMDLFDYKPQLAQRFGEEVPQSVYPDERKTTMTSGQNSFPVAPS